MASRFRKYADRHGFLTLLLNLKRVAKGYQPIFLDYPVDASPRYGYGKPPHPEISAVLAANHERYLRTLTSFLQFDSELLALPRAASDAMQPFWDNEWFTGLDLFALYGFIATRKPALYVEIGSGQSTKIARRAVATRALPTRIVSLDPHPRAEIDKLCDEVIRRGLESADLSLFQQLKAGDIVFFDGSHRAFMNSDVTVFFLEVLPRLAPGVLVQIHDIFLPDDYVPWWQQKFYPHRYWSEQYVLAASLLGGHKNYEVLLPNHYLGSLPEAVSLLQPFWANPRLQGVPAGGSSFWIETR